MTPSKSMFMLLATLFCITGAAIYTAKTPAPAPKDSALGVAAYLIACAPKDNAVSACKSVAAIQGAYKFDLLTDIAATHAKMKKTTRDIVQGRLTAASYKDCVARGSCASIPMIDKDAGLSPRDAKKVSRQFWQLAEHEELTPEICGLIQTCSIGLRNGALAPSKNIIIAAPAKAQAPRAGTARP